MSKSIVHEAPAEEAITTRFLQLKHEYSEQELSELGKELAENEHECKIAYDEKAAAMKQHNSIISDLEQRINELVNNIRNGHEMRDTECTITMHTPKQFRKTIVRNDTGETWIEDMTDDDNDLFL